MVTICIPLQSTKLNDQNATNILFVRYHVHITNDFFDQSVALLVQCKSGGGKDLGLHTLKQHEQFEWSFKMDVWRRTRYTCLAQQSPVTIAQHIYLKSKNFTAFKPSREEYGCLPSAHCYWSIREQGFFFSSDNSTWGDPIYTWDDTASCLLPVTLLSIGDSHCRRVWVVVGAPFLTTPCSISGPEIVTTCTDNVSLKLSLLEISTRLEELWQNLTLTEDEEKVLIVDDEKDTMKDEQIALCLLGRLHTEVSFNA
ncbi:hypothetical protein Cgig2_029879 [Carnegiea gigantea]|uniref:S-protein homolog n=1 Tax=Carnegiea gigantea TaxID=171969 RepID=A0A9Q1QBY7_9CARY|nr:hypothetical protein Cgig2_029879 [Carnegiea gigantea]